LRLLTFQKMTRTLPIHWRAHERHAADHGEAGATAGLPRGVVGADTWSFTNDAPAELPRQLLVRMSWISVDPGMRGWITPKRSYMPPVQSGEVMRAFGVGEVVASQAEKFRPGTW